MVCRRATCSKTGLKQNFKQHVLLHLHCQWLKPQWQNYCCTLLQRGRTSVAKLYCCCGEVLQWQNANIDATFKSNWIQFNLITGPAARNNYKTINCFWDFYIGLFGVWNLESGRQKKVWTSKKNPWNWFGEGHEKKLDLKKKLESGVWTSKKKWSLWSLESGRPKKFATSKKNWGGAAPPPKTPLHAADKTRGGHFEEGRQNRTESISKFWAMYSDKKSRWISTG